MQNAEAVGDTIFDRGEVRDRVGYPILPVIRGDESLNVRAKGM